ncbi:MULTISPECIES: hypothetical protein [unclassified Acinetobacter]|uniref:hypothetical protein n=1 Tax=unclassified Acinetobacter TaxID=196816 RepID=UPI0015D259D0
MSNYIPPNRHQVNLNFKEPATGSTNLEFGADDQNIASLNAIVSTVIAVEFNAESYSNDVLDAQINTGFYAEFNVVSGQFSQLVVIVQNSFIAEFKAVRIDQYGAIDTVIQTSLTAQFEALFDINHLVGVSYGFNTQYQKALACLSVMEIPWAKPILRVSNEALFYERSLVLSNQVDVRFEQAGSLNHAVRSTHEQTTGLNSDAYMVWEQGETRFIHQLYVHEESIKLRHNRESRWQEMIRRRKQFTYSHELAKQFEKRFSFEWDKGLEIVTKSDLPWDKAKSIHYRKHPVQPWPKPDQKPKRQPVHLNFCCPSKKVSRFNIVLNFDEDKCAKQYIPQLNNPKWWYIVNNLSAERLDNAEPIKVINGTYNCSRSTWCWSYSITVAHTEKEKLQPLNEQPVILKLIINGFEHHVLLETETETIKFANKSYTYDGRSVTALNAADYANKRSFIQDNERTSVQLVQAEIDRAQSGTELDWKLIDDVGWIVPVESLSYAELAPMDAIKQVVEAGGGFIYSQKSGNTLSILPRYKNGYWDAMTVDDYDILISQSIVIQQTIEQNKDYIADFNAINVVNSRSGDSLTVKQRNTAGDVPLEAVSGPMFDVVSGASFGKMELIKANIQEFHTLSGLPVAQEIGEMLPGKTVAFHGQWWGVIDSVSGSFNHGKVTESIKVERIHRD